MTIQTFIKEREELFDEKFKGIESIKGENGITHTQIDHSKDVFPQLKVYEKVKSFHRQSLEGIVEVFKKKMEKIPDICSKTVQCQNCKYLNEVRVILYDYKKDFLSLLSPDNEKRI